MAGNGRYGVVLCARLPERSSSGDALKTAGATLHSLYTHFSFPSIGNVRSSTAHSFIIMAPQLQQPAAVATAAAPWTPLAVGAPDGASPQLLQFQLAAGAVAQGGTTTIISCKTRSSMGRVLPLAWLHGPRRVAPFARVGSGAVWSPSASTDALAKQLLASEEEEDGDDKQAQHEEAARRCVRAGFWLQETFGRPSICAPQHSATHIQPIMPSPCRLSVHSQERPQ